MKITKYKASEQLANSIFSYSILEATNPSIICSGKTLPHGYFELLFNLGEPIQISCSNQIHSIKQNDSIFLGQLMSSIQFQLPKKLNLLLVKVYPWAIPAFINYPVAELQDKIIPLELLLGNTIPNLVQQLMEANTHRIIIQRLEHFFIKKLASNKNIPKKPLQVASSLILQQKGFISIKEILAQVPVSRRTLELQFKNQLGITSTQFARKARLRYVAATLSNQSAMNYTTLAHWCGYFDQSHFIRDFKAVMHQTPTLFFKETPFVEDFWLG